MLSQKVTDGQFTDFSQVKLTADSEREVIEVLRTEAKKPFNLENGPLIRATLFTPEKGDFILLINFHHIIFDGISSLIFINELVEQYRALVEKRCPNLQALEADYGQFVQQQQAYLESDRGKNAKEYWMAQMEGYNPPLELNISKSRTLGQAYNGSRYSLKLEADLTQRLSAFSVESGISLFTIMLCAYNVLLYNYSGRKDIIVGVPVAGRNSSKFEKVIGYFINLLPFRCDFSKDTTYTEFLLKNQENFLESLQFSDYPYYSIVQEWRKKCGIPDKELVNVSFYFQNWLKTAQASQNSFIRGSIDGVGQDGEFDLTLEVFQKDSIFLNFKFNPDIFEMDLVQRISEQYINLLWDIIEHRNKSIYKAAILPEAEKNRILVKWNDTASEYQRETRVHELFERQAQMCPESVAVVFGQYNMTYSELDNKADMLAESLRKSGVAADSTVGVYMTRSADIIVALLGIFKAGGVYVPLDPSYPKDRIDYIINDSDISILLSQTSLEDKWSLLPVPVIAIDKNMECVQKPLRQNDNMIPEDNSDLAYIIHTSGSSGKPKGVAVRHQGLTNFLLSMAEKPGCTQKDYLLALTTICFDISLLELLLPLVTGGTVEVLPERIIHDGILLKETIETSKATIIQATPATWKILQIAGWTNSKAVKILCGGEALNNELADFLLKGGEREVWNLYGPTETTIWSTVHKLVPSEKTLIGKPIRNTQCYILNSYLQPVPTCVSGDLYIGGDGLAKGYLNQPVLMQERFIPSPFGQAGERLYKTGDIARYTDDGLIEFLGRSDQQVKLHGFRIELSEIETTLQKIEGIDAAIASVRKDGNGNASLVAFVISKRESKPDAALLKEKLANWLPAYMIPSRFVRLESFPMTLNKKVDRNTLDKIDIDEIITKYGGNNGFVNESVAIREKGENSTFQKDLVRIVARVGCLKEDEVKETVHLGDYGFDSLKFTELSAAVNNTYGIKIYPTVFYQHPDIKTLTVYIEQTFKSKIDLYYKNAPHVNQCPATAVAEEIKASTQQETSGNRLFENQSVAVVGASAMLPGSPDLETFWDNLVNSRDLITEIPKERWPEDETVNSPDFPRWGGFIDNIDKFDPGFFGISPREAELMDPQQRLFLEMSWKAIEDSGHKPSELSGTRTGVYVGVTSTDYEEKLGKSSENVEAYSLTGMARTIIANRVSYLLNLKGPSSAIDTACSSSMVAIHRAVRAIQQGDCDMALAGGVNLLISAVANIAFSKNGMTSKDGHCKTFDKSANGYVRGEGVAAVFLKPLSKAIEDNDHIYGVILGSAENHGGKTNSLTAPNPNAQAELIAEAYEHAGIEPGTVTYIETHGTGTPLGDPVEINGLKLGFESFYKKNGGVMSSKPVCGLGSVKTNIGHLEAAAGVTGLLKVLMSIKYRKIPSNIHLKELNPFIELENSPFYIVKQLRDWEPLSSAGGKKLPLRAGVSSFGMGGSNVHLVLEEYIKPLEQNCRTSQLPNIFVLSAKNKAQLHEYAGLFVSFMEKNKEYLCSASGLESLVYTLQSGREEMKERLAIVFGSFPELLNRITAYYNEKQPVEGVFTGNTKAASNDMTDIMNTGEGTDFAKELIKNREMEKLAQLWVKGKNIRWSVFYEGLEPQRISVPTYPFAREIYWVNRNTSMGNGAGHQGKVSALTALIDSNESTLEEQCFKKRLFKDEFFLKHHIVGGRIILPGVVYLEMMRMAGELASRKAAVVQIKNIVWGQPVIIEDDYKDIFIKLYPSDNAVEFQVVSVNGDNENVIHSNGSLVYGTMEKKQVDLEELKGRFMHAIQGDELYKAFPAAGFDYGPTFKAIREAYYNGEEAFSHIRINEGISEAAKEFLLHPSVMEGALQTAVGLLADGDEERNERYLPFSMGEVRIHGSIENEMYAYVVQKGKTASSHGKSRTFDILIINPNGDVAVSIKDYVLHTIEKEEPCNTLFYKVDWSPDPVGKTVNPASIPGTTLLFDNDDSVDMGCLGNGSSIIRIYEGNEYKKLGDKKYCINPSDKEHYIQLFADIKPIGISNIIHNWSEGEFDASEGRESQSYIRSVLSVFYIAKALAANRMEGKIRLIFTYCSTKPGSNPLFGAMSGLLKTIAAENPKCLVKSIEFTGKINWQAVADEISDTGNWASEVLYDGNKRYTQIFEEINPLEHSVGKVMFRNSGVYLITGGVGAIGLHIAQFLAKNYKARLVLNSRNNLSDKHQDIINNLEQHGAEVLYIQGDVSLPGTAEKLIEKTKERFGTLNGIIHCAGITLDNLLINKNKEEFEQVLGSKLWGTSYLDEASAKEPMDFFVMFSSLSSVFGNIGQGDYSYANSFMDKFAYYREALREEKLRSGRTVSINWPLWEAGGIMVDEAYKDIYKERLGISTMSTASGLDAIMKILEFPFSQIVVLEGNRRKIRDFFNRSSYTSQNKASQSVTLEMDMQDLKEYVLKDLIRISSDILKSSPEKIDPMEEMTQYGYDSLSFMDLSKAINTTFNMDITPSVFFEYTKLDNLADYISIQGKDTLSEKYLKKPVIKNDVAAAPILKFRHEPAVKSYLPSGVQPTSRHEPIAVIGMFGVMPQSDDLDEFWDHLVNGRNLVTEVPEDRWDWREYYGNPLTEKNKTNSKWGAFIRGVDRFDASFFGISPKEAKMMDPQQRIFIEVLWSTLEDAGYKVSDLSQKRVGVFIGVSNSDYVDIIKEAGEDIDVHGMIGNGYPYLANRISFLLNLKGPSEPIDTLCSSSLVSIHTAIESIRNGSSDLAIAGGINVILKPTLNIFYSKAGMLSLDGMCKTFDKDANGFVRGEGAGAILLKPLSKAVEDGDKIYAVIKGSAVNHGGRSSTITSPNAAAQTDVIVRAMEEAQIDPRTIGYIEAHGTGTALGDPVEVAALTKAFETMMEKGEPGQKNKNFCAIGSVKTNIGHLESAAGIAGFIKVLLSIKNKLIPANLHFNQLNQFIKIQDSPFYIADKKINWEPSYDSSGNLLPRRAGISAFGAGGVNTHIILEEYIQPEHQNLEERLCIITLSAKTCESLEEYAGRLLSYLDKNENAGLVEIAYTLQNGREAMRYRLAVLASDISELKEILDAFIQNPGRKDIPNLYYGDSVGDNAAYTQLIRGEEGREYIESVLRNRRYTSIAAMWVNGVEFNWKLLYQNERILKIPLPVYPFKHERYWVKTEKKRKTTQVESLHPLIDRVLPVLPSEGVVFEKKLTCLDLAISQHRVMDRMFLPGVAHLEMAYAAIKLLDKNRTYKLSQVVWQSPIELGDGEKPIQIVVKDMNGKLCFEIKGHEDNGTVVYSKGLYIPIENGQKIKKVDIQAIIDRCDMCIDPDALYMGFKSIGINHGKYLQSVKEIRCSKNEALGILELPLEFLDELEQYSLHPSIMDSALQGMMSFIKDDGTERKTLLPFMVEEAEYIKPLTSKCYSYLKPAGLNKFNIAILDEDGVLCVRISGLMLRAMQKPQYNIFYTPRWVRQDAAKTSYLDKPGKENVLIIYPPDADYVREALERLHTDDDVHCIKLGTCSRQESPNSLEIDMRNQEDWEAGINRIPVIDRVYFLGGLAAQCSDYEPDQKVFEDSQEFGIYSIFRLVKALGRHKGLSNEFKLKAVATGLYPENKGSISEAFSASIDGFLRVVSKEYPAWQVTCLGADLQEETSNTKLSPNSWIMYLYNEPAHRNSEAVSIRRGVRYVRMLEPAIIPAVKEPSVRRGGVYVILGGMGGIGLKLAEFLAEKAKAKLALIGRRELDTDIEKQIEVLKSMGAEVMYIRGDSNDRNSLETAIERIRSEYGNINGAFHSALELHDTSIDKMDENTFRRAYEIKAAGCFNFWSVLKNEPLDFIVFFSSVQSIFGGIGQANYVAGCAFEDALSLALNYKSNYSVKVINWGKWGKVGAVAGDEYDLRFKSQGIRSILPDEGIDALMRILSHPCSQTVVFKAEDELIKKMGINRNSSRIFLPVVLPPLIKTLENESDSRIGYLDYEGLKEPFKNLGWLCRLMLFNKLQKYFNNETLENVKKKLGVIPEYDRLFEELISILQRSGLVGVNDGALYVVPEAVSGELSQQMQRLSEIKEQIVEKYPSVKPHVNLLSKGLEQLEEILSGKAAATEVLFPAGSNHLVAGVYQGNPVADYFNRVVAAKAASYIGCRLSEKTENIKILEVGAGTGSTSKFVLKELAPFSDRINYLYTDISSGFIQHGRNTFASKYSFVKFGILDIEKDLRQQDMNIGDFDVVIAANVLHATKDIKETLSNVKALLKTNGILILNEVTENDEFSTLTFGLLKGWWLYGDSENRLPGGPLLSAELWEKLLEEEGFAASIVKSESVNQHVILGESDGIVRIIDTSQSKADIVNKQNSNLIRIDSKPKSASVKKSTAAVPTGISRKSNTEDVIVALVAKALDMEPGTVDRKRPFFEYGIDSLNGVELVNKLSEIFKVELSKTVIFDYSSVSEMAAYIGSLLKRKNIGD
ncbi:MAG TPA: amino acid adenylation domain-containing protein [Ruminiclostridium sp.]|nr:amino acid adenylation domain-containing protein [Ruminiclostridium sp.]